MNHQDLKQVVFHKHQIKQPNNTYSQLSHEVSVQRKLESNDIDIVKTKQLSNNTRQLLQKTRIDKKWSQKELATKLNVKPDIVQNIETGKLVPDPHLLQKIKKTLGISNTRLN